MTINDFIKRLQQLRKAVPGDSEIVFSQAGDYLGCKNFTFDVSRNKIVNEPLCCYRCLKDPRCLSNDKTHRLCSRVCAEVSLKECEEIRKIKK